MSVVESRGIGKRSAGVNLPVVIASSLGMLLVLAGSGLLLYLGWMVAQGIEQPERIGLIKYFMEQVNLTEQAVYGQVQYQNFSINLSPPIRSALFILVGVLIFSAFAGILKAILTAGIQLLTFAGEQRRRDT